ncbi:MAG TPA: type II toxin-antitoxin system Phd/YefM family antitoxin [Terriglobales bacterium]|jgi:prevent-host-death family protein|nr:type II toxin-antitoxin system Phd/YefM family antitoxin [Terriglobales bacterium]HXU16886.1 type II toxin-antitoxin system Phd/YefM family antitoxin [Terriglobales bacterium]
MKTVPAAKFKANCLALMDKVQETGEFVVITKHGKPVAKLVPAERERRNMWGDLAGTVKILGDIESPVTNDWEAS